MFGIASIAAQGTQLCQSACHLCRLLCYKLTCNAAASGRHSMRSRNHYQVVNKILDHTRPHSERKILQDFGIPAKKFFFQDIGRYCSIIILQQISLISHARACVRRPNEWCMLLNLWTALFRRRWSCTSSCFTVHAQSCKLISFRLESIHPTVHQGHNPVELLELQSYSIRLPYLRCCP